MSSCILVVFWCILSYPYQIRGIHAGYMTGLVDFRGQTPYEKHIKSWHLMGAWELDPARTLRVHAAFINQELDPEDRSLT